MIDDEFGTGDLLKGDQGANNEEVQLIEEDAFDSDADEEDKQFLKDLSKPVAKKEPLKKQKSTVSKQSAKREQAWAGNGLGSGTLQE